MFPRAHYLSCILILLLFFQSSDGYDPMDPNGNITIKWDFQTIAKVYTVMVNIYNYQLYRHIEPPGWMLSWTWAGEEVIWNMVGGEATEQGNCSRFKGETIPHCCEKNPVIVDLPVGIPYNKQVANCCRGGVLSSTVQDPTKYMSSFQMVVGNSNGSDATTAKPTDFSIGIPGYTCSNAIDAAPSKFRSDKHRTTQALMTWEITCSYSQFRESELPSCCVSLSTFYNDTIVSCPRCSCGCQSSPTSLKCIREDEQSNLLQLPNGDDESTPSVVTCTQHMCPIRVHWHLKLNYREYWRAKVTVTNFNVARNYSDWNLVIQHPNLRNLTQVFSFNYQPLIQYGDTNDTGMFWGIKTYNDMLLQSGKSGNVQSEMLLKKDLEEFTFKGGWAFPRRISFNGHDCVMPSPDSYPSLPNGSPTMPILIHLFLGLSPLLLFAVVLHL